MLPVQVIRSHYVQPGGQQTVGTFVLGQDLKLLYHISYFNATCYPTLNIISFVTPWRDSVNVIICLRVGDCKSLIQILMK